MADSSDTTQDDYEYLKNLRPNHRRRVIDERITNGTLRKKPRTDDEKYPFQYYYEQNGNEFKYLKCDNCHIYLSAFRGGHQTKHKYGECAEGPQQDTPTGENLNDVLCDKIVEYCMRTGESFHHLESEEYRQLLRETVAAAAPNIDVNKLVFPNRKKIRQLVEQKADKIIIDIGEEIRPHVKSGCASIVLDFGLHIENYLSAFIVFIEIDQGVPKLTVRPYAFQPTFLSKTAENIKDMIDMAAEKFGLSASDIEKLTIVSDGAANLVKLGKTFFRRYAKCGCHSIQKMSERTVNPTIMAKCHYTIEELQELDKCEKLLDKCANLSSMVHRNKRSLEISPLPDMYIETRWQTQVKCARSIKNILTKLVDCGVSKISSLAKEIEEEYAKLNTVIEVLSVFEDLLLLFELSSSTIHLFLPKIYALHSNFREKERISDDNLVAKALYKSGKVVTEIYLQNDISDVHIMATFLSPRMKKMTKLGPQYRLKAQQLVEEELDKMEENEANIKNLPANGLPKNSIADLYDAPAQVSPRSELTEYLAEQVFCEEDDPLIYWGKKTSQFPNLSRIAFSVFAIFTSETVCERAFSIVKKVVSNERTRLDPFFVEKLMLAYFASNSTH